jgi:hypothetical protein
MRYITTIHGVGEAFSAPTGGAWLLHSVHLERGAIIVVWQSEES